MSVPGHRIGQAANLAHEYLLGRGYDPLKEKEMWESLMGEYIPFLTDMEKKFSNSDEDWTDKVPQKKAIPVKIIDEDMELVPADYMSVGIDEISQ